MTACRAIAAVLCVAMISAGSTAGFADLFQGWEQDRQNREMYAGRQRDDMRDALKNSDFNLGINQWKAQAEQGNAEAQFRMGKLYREGNASSVFYDKALEWYQKSAAQGYAPAQTDLAGMHYLGLGTAKNLEEAAKLTKMAADSGYLAAVANMGTMYEEGSGVPQNNVSAYMWYSLAVSGDEQNKILLAKRDALAAKMTPEQIAEAKKLASEWKAQKPAK